MYTLGDSCYKLKFAARRMKQRFPGILNVTYNKKIFKFRHTYKTRTRDSARAYVKGLFETLGKHENDYPCIVRTYKLRQITLNLTVG